MLLHQGGSANNSAVAAVHVQSEKTAPLEGCDRLLRVIKKIKREDLKEAITTSIRMGITTKKDIPNIGIR